MYTWFYQHILCWVVGRPSWRRQHLHRRGSEIASVSDEAFALLVIDNCWSSWIARSAGPDTDDISFQALVSAEPLLKNKVSCNSMTEAEKKRGQTYRAKELKRRIKYTGKTGRASSGGWSIEGLDKYNTLCLEVMQDREKDDGKFDDHYMAMMKENGTKGGKPMKWVRVGVEVYSDLTLHDCA